MFVLFLFLMSISLAAVAGAFSIIGLMSIYPASAIGVLIGAVVIEICKLATISFFYQFYNIIGIGKKIIAGVFIVISMAITSMGVYGYLTKVYIEQIAPMANTEIRIANIDAAISRHQFNIDQSLTQLQLMDEATKKYIELGAVSRSVAVNSERDSERQRHNMIIIENQNYIDKLVDEKTELSISIKQLEAEVGPIQYIADLLFKDSENNRDTALKWFSIIMVLAIDPFAVVLLVFANTAYKHRNDPRLNKEFGGLMDKKEKHDSIELGEGVSNQNNMSTEDIISKVDEFLKKKDEIEESSEKDSKPHDNSELIELLKNATKKSENDIQNETNKNQRNGWL
jgi:hypothetical protein